MPPSPMQMIVLHPVTGERCSVDFARLMAAARELAADGIDVERMSFTDGLVAALLRLEQSDRAA